MKRLKRKAIGHNPEVDPQVQPPDDLMEKMQVLSEKSDKFDKTIRDFKETVKEFHKWNPLGGSIPNTRIIKKWRHVMTTFLYEASELNTELKDVFHIS